MPKNSKSDHRVDVIKNVKQKCNVVIYVWIYVIPLIENINRLNVMKNVQNHVNLIILVRINVLNSVKNVRIKLMSNYLNAITSVKFIAMNNKNQNLLFAIEMY